MPGTTAEEAHANTLEPDVVAVRGAIALVASGTAIGVTLCGLHDAVGAAADAEDEARASGLALTVLASASGAHDLLLGPRPR